MFIVAGRITQFVLLLLSLIISLVLIRMVLSGKKMPSMRVFPAIEAIKEGIGRATETNRPVVFNNGWGGILSAEYSVQTLAGINLLAYAASITAKTNTRLIVPLYQGATFPLVLNTVYQTYQAADALEEYNKSVDIRYISDEQWPWISAVMGLLRRERPACNILFGFFWGESLLQTESGYLSGAMQIGGTAQMDAIPYFAATVDYFLIGEELYAASAYVSGDEIERSTVFAEDLIKVVILAILVVGSLLMAMGNDSIVKLVGS